MTKKVEIRGSVYQLPKGVEYRGSSIRVMFTHKGKRFRPMHSRLCSSDVNIQDKIDDAFSKLNELKQLIALDALTDNAIIKRFPLSAKSTQDRMTNKPTKVKDLVPKVVAFMQQQASTGQLSHSTCEAYKKRLVSPCYMGPISECTDSVINQKGLNEYLLSDLSLMTLQKYQLALQKDERKNKTVNLGLDAVRYALKYAVADGLISSNPCVGLKALPVALKKPIVFTIDEFSLYASKAREIDRSWLANLFLFGCHTGMRVEELRALSWHDIDLEKKVMKIRRAYTSGVFKGVKHKTRDREVEVPLLKDALKVLMDQKIWTNGLPEVEVKVIRKTGIFYEKCQFVFQNQLKLNEPCSWTEQALSKQWITVQKAVGSQEPKPLSIVRHTFASRLISVGASSYMVAQMLGHTSSKMVEEKYAGFFEELGGGGYLASLQIKLDSTIH